MTSESLVLRMLCSRSRVNLRSIREGFHSFQPQRKQRADAAAKIQDLYLSGYQMGERIVSLVDSGLVALFIATPGQLNIQPRLDGAAAAIKKSGKKIDIQTIATGATVNEELSKIKFSLKEKAKEKSEA